MRLAWATDIHLNFLPPAEADAFPASIVAAEVDALLLGGDIAEGLDLEEWLAFLACRIRRPIHFVLGNHDYYASDVATMEAKARAVDPAWLHYLGGAEPVELAPGVGLVGHGGWADAGYGDFVRDGRIISDHVLIRDLRECTGSDDPLALIDDRNALARKLRSLGLAAAAELEPSLRSAVARFDDVLVLTHVPPFLELATADLACRALGDLLLSVAGEKRRCRLTVLSGHTHQDARVRLLPNLRACTQAARYGAPSFRILPEDPLGRVGSAT